MNNEIVNLKKKNIKSKTQPIAYKKKYEIMRESKKIYKKRISKLHQQVHDQNLIIENQKKQIANFLKKIFETFNSFQSTQFKKWSFDQFLINYQSTESYQQSRITNLIEIFLKFEELLKSQLYDCIKNTVSFYTKRCRHSKLNKSMKYRDFNIK